MLTKQLNSRLNAALRRVLAVMIVMHFAPSVLAAPEPAAPEPAAPESAATDTTAVVKLEMTGLADVNGKLFVAAYNSEDTWLGENAAGRIEVVIEQNRVDGIVHAQIHLVPGEYALSVFYDKNNNGKLDANFIGIPKEPVAISNNAKGKFGPPKYADARFNLDAAGGTQRIDIIAID